MIGPEPEEFNEVICSISQHVEIDQVSTFTGQIECDANPLIRARKKCLLTSKESGNVLTVYKEGPFSTHSAHFHSPADLGHTCVLNQSNDRRIVACIHSTSTDCPAKQITSNVELARILDLVPLSSQSAIIRLLNGNSEVLTKELTNPDHILPYFNKPVLSYNSLYVGALSCSPTIMSTISPLHTQRNCKRCSWSHRKTYRTERKPGIQPLNISAIYKSSTKEIQDYTK